MADFPAIRALIRQVRINPIGLDWRRFIVAVLDTGEVVGCGQVKPIPGGLSELASLAVKPSQRKQGIAAAILTQLTASSPRPLYLICRSALGEFYGKYGFENLEGEEMPRYYRRLQRLVGILIGFTGRDESLQVMKLG